MNILDIFFPKKCLDCNKSDTYLCRACFDKIEIVPRIKQKQRSLDKIISATDYRNPVVREMIKKFKYNYVKELAKPLSQLLIKSLSQCWKSDFQHNDFQHNVLIIPIPLYKYRERGRGFNQAELLAKQVANYFNLSLKTDILKRTMPTEPQADIRDEERRKINIKGVFDVDPVAVRGTNILLVDDVATTGATLLEAGKILKKNGANKVWGLVVAKGK